MSQKRYSSKSVSRDDSPPLSRRSSYAGSISDVEREESDTYNKYKKMAKKLSKDKTELKDKLRKVIEDKDREHRIELQKTQDYFQRQISELGNQKDKLSSSLQDLKKKITDEKDKNQDNNRQVDLLEKKLSNKDNQIKRLEDTIKDFQEKLSQMEFSSTINEKMLLQEEYYKKLISSLETENKILLEKDRNNSRLTDEAVKNAIDDKDTIIYALQKKLLEFNEKFSKLEKEKEEYKKTLENKVVTLEQQLIERADDLKKQYESQYSDTKDKYEMQLSKQRFESDRTLEETKKSFEKKIDIVNSEYKKSVSDLELQVERLHKKNTDEFNIMKVTLEKKLLETQEENKRLNDYVKQLKENNRKQQDTFTLTNSQFIANMNKQKELSDSEINSRNQIIEQLEIQLRKLGEESVERINLLERKGKASQAELRELNEKYTEAKILYEKAHFEANFFRPEIDRLRDTIDNISEKLKISMENNDLYQKTIKELSYKVQEKDASLTKQSAEVAILLDSVHGLERENQELRATYKMSESGFLEVKSENVKMGADLTHKKERIKELLEERIMMEGKIKYVETERDSALKQVASVEEKLNQLQIEFAGASTMITTKTEMLNQRYEEMKKYEEKMKDKLMASENNEKMAKLYKDDTEKLRSEINRLKADFVVKLNNMTKEMDEKDKQVDYFREQSKGVVTKEREMLELIKKLNESKVVITKYEAMYKAEVETLTAKVKEQERLLYDLRNENETLKTELDEYMKEDETNKAKEQETEEDEE